MNFSMGSMRNSLALCGFALVLLVLPARGEVYLSPEKFLSESFGGATPPPEFVWLTGALAGQAEAVLGHKPAGLRIRYWALGARSAWILDEIGKTEAITAGVVVEDQKIARMQVLEYRESRGAEVRHAFFTNQFIGLGLQEDTRLSGALDGISGATLSVRAMENMARLALLLARHAQAAQSSAP